MLALTGVASPHTVSLAASVEARVDDLYASSDMAALWIGGPAAEARRNLLLSLLAVERRHDPSGADVKDLSAAFASLGAEQQEAADRRLSAAALAYLERRAGGVVSPSRARRAFQRLDRAAVGSALALPLVELEIVAELGGWRPVGTVLGLPPKVKPLAVVSPEIDVVPRFPPRKRLPELTSLRQRLVQSRDLPSRYRSGGPSMDVHTVNAVKLFQARHGLVADGVVGPRTLAALNAPIGRELAQVRINIARGEPDRSALRRYVEVNVPAYELRLVEDGRVTLRSRVIVGDAKSPTPIFDDLIRTIEVNPSWYVPRSIADELLEKEEKKPGYLAANGFYWRASPHGGPDRLIQRPGPENALGRVKFLFPNHHAVYLHDTPQRGLFGRSQRSLSHGCVRVEKPLDLALALLREQGWDAKRLAAAFASTKTRKLDLTSPVPVFLDYRTAFVDERGRLNLRADLYGHDAAGVRRFDDKAPPRDRPADAVVSTSNVIQVRPQPRPHPPAIPAEAVSLVTAPAPAPL